MKAGAGNISHTMDSLHAEMIAAWEGIRLAAEAGMGHVILETDEARGRGAAPMETP